MTFNVIFIVLVSTFMHAGWNLLARYYRSETIFYYKMVLLTTIAGFVPAVWSEAVTHSMTPLAWACVTSSGICASLYLFGLARAYEASDFTIVYPVVRSLPVVFIGFIDVLRGRYLTPLGWLGITFVVAGCALVPLRSIREIRLSHYLNRTTLWMLLGAAGMVGYSVLDKIAAEVVQQGPATAARYGYFYFAISLIPYLFLMRTFKSQRQDPGTDDWKLAIIAAVLGFTGYWLILWAYQLSPYASYIVAFRQFSIVIGAVLAFIIYKEQGVKVRLSGALLIASGLVLIAGWGR
jgi:drug/metabolite transporter (DMT)-like permease